MKFDVKEFKEVIAYISDDEKAIDEVNHRINFIVSSEILDRDGEIVEAQAVMEGIVRKDEFVANPVCLISHQHRLADGTVPSIGSWLTDTARLAGKRVRMDLQYDIELELGKQYWIAYKNKTMRAVSISFRIKDYRVEEINGKQAMIVTALEMVEISVCAVGANKLALSQLKGLGLLSAEVKDVPGTAAEFLTAMEKRITESFKVQLEGQFDRLKLMLLDKHDPDGCGVDDLGDPLIPSGEEIKAEDVLTVLQKIVNENSME